MFIKSVKLKFHIFYLTNIMLEYDQLLSV